MYQLPERGENPQNKSFTFDCLYEIQAEKFCYDSNMEMKPNAKIQEKIEEVTGTTVEEVAEENKITDLDTPIRTGLFRKIGGQFPNQPEKKWRSF